MNYDSIPVERMFTEHRLYAAFAYSPNCAFIFLPERKKWTAMRWEFEQETLSFYSDYAAFGPCFKFAQSREFVGLFSRGLSDMKVTGYADIVSWIDSLPYSSQFEDLWDARWHDTSFFQNGYFLRENLMFAVRAAEQQSRDEGMLPKAKAGKQLGSLQEAFSESGGGLSEQQQLMGKQLKQQLEEMVEDPGLRGSVIEESLRRLEMQRYDAQRNLEREVRMLERQQAIQSPLLSVNNVSNGYLPVWPQISFNNVDWSVLQPPTLRNSFRRASPSPPTAKPKEKKAISEKTNPVLNTGRKIDL